MDQRIWGEVAGDCEQLFINISSRLSSFDPISLPSPPPTSESFLEITMAEYGDGGQCNVKRSSVGEGEKENNQPIAMQCWLWSLCHKASMRVKWNGLSGSEGKVRTKGAWTKVWLYSDFNALPLAYGGISSAGLSPGEELTLHSSFLCLYCQSVLYVTFKHSFSDKRKS